MENDFVMLRDYNYMLRRLWEWKKPLEVSLLVVSG